MRTQAALAFGFLLCCTLFACRDEKPAHMPTGKPVAAPQGAVEFCRRNPSDEMCKP